MIGTYPFGNYHCFGDSGESFTVIFCNCHQQNRKNTQTTVKNHKQTVKNRKQTVKNRKHTVKNHERKTVKQHFTHKQG